MPSRANDSARRSSPFSLAVRPAELEMSAASFALSACGMPVVAKSLRDWTTSPPPAFRARVCHALVVAADGSFVLAIVPHTGFPFES
jgi:hypothetical protein